MMKTGMGARHAWPLALLVCAAVYLAVLPMAGTIALRNVLLALLLLGALLWPRPCAVRPDADARWLVGLGAMWAVYLLVFPWFAEAPAAVAANVWTQWGKGVLAGLVGVAVAQTLRGRWDGISPFVPGVLSAVPIVVHLVLSGWKGLAEMAIPWGYWGRETHHADLGYAAGQAVILLGASLAARPSGGGGVRQRVAAGLLMVLCCVSLALAQSRAGLAFCVFGVLSVMAAWLLPRGRQPSPRHGHAALAGLAGLLLAAALVWLLALKEDSRWGLMLARMEGGLLGNPITLQCEGTGSIEADIVARYGPGPLADEVIAGVRNGDGSRVVVLRAAFKLALKHPWGSNGSRQAFRELLQQECSSPVLHTAHAHNGWLDMMLALGWPAAGLYLALLWAFCRMGWRHLRSTDTANPWALVLVALSLFWMVRGLTDSVFRDHMLEMQGLVLAFAAFMLRSVASSTVGSGASDAPQLAAQAPAQTR